MWGVPETHFFIFPDKCRIFYGGKYCQRLYKLSNIGLEEMLIHLLPNAEGFQLYPRINFRLKKYCSPSPPNCSTNTTYLQLIL
jgi:hypothetical protein